MPKKKRPPKPKHRVGTTVKIKSRLTVGNCYGAVPVLFSKSMEKYIGQTTVIQERNSYDYLLAVDEGKHVWTDEMLTRP